jgi:4-diphosphocytidyl-2-C-methyl-D-erythritol kinase
MTQTSQPHRAYAKINLGLFVLRKRPDGYHDIATVFHRVDLFDEITFTESPTICVLSDEPAAPGGDKNICSKAARLLQGAIGTTAGVAITLNKKIPVGAGLGGGSSDAATVIRELPSFWNARVNTELLHRLAMQLGSDVPFFLLSGSAFAKGRGENLTPVNLDIPYAILLCYPNVHISTPWAYAHLKLTPVEAEVDVARIVATGMTNPGWLRENLRNDFEPVVFNAYPEVSRVKEAMLHGGATYASLSGSGSSVYGMFPDAARATAVGHAFAVDGYRTFLTPPHFRAPVV